MKRIVSLLTALSLLIVNLYISLPVSALSVNVGVTYQGHVQNIGWQPLVSDGALSGTTGLSLQMEAVKIQLTNAPLNASIVYDSYVANVGWQSKVSDGAQSGTSGRSLAIEAIRVSLVNMPGYSIEYQVHLSNYGWQAWMSDGNIAGIIGKGNKIEATRIRIVKVSDNISVGVQYDSHVETIGWQTPVFNGSLSGTEGKALRLEAFRVSLVNAPVGGSIHYETHVQNIGWMPGVQDGIIAGTEGRALRMEAIKISLVNMTGYSVQYRAHVQNIGWQAWVSDGAVAGTSGLSLRVEAIEIRIISNPLEFTFPSSLTLSKTTDILNVGSTDRLVPTILPNNTTDKSVSWISSDPAVASVDSTGLITAISVGTTTITATTALGNISSTCEITVVIPVSSITVTGESSVDNGQTLQLGVTIEPSNATDQTIAWTVETLSGGTATIDVNGLLTATGVGTVTVTATNLVSGVSGFKVVTVNINAVDAALNAVNEATNRSSMALALKANEVLFGINMTDGDYGSMDISRKPSVAQYVIDSKPTIGYTSFAQVKASFDAGLAYETAKWSFSTALFTDTLTSTDVTAIRAAYIAHKAYRLSVGKSDDTATAIAALDRLAANFAEFKIALETQFNDNTAANGALTNAYRINDVFRFINILSAVESAETTPTQDNVNIAQGLVTAMPTGSAKTALQGRIDVIQASINATIAAENAIAALEAVDWTTANDAAVTQGIAASLSARLLIEAALAGTRSEFGIRLDVVDEMLSARQAELALTASTIVFADGETVAKLSTDENFTNAVSGEGTGAITYSSGTPSTATVNATTGEVTIVGIGTTIITAVKAATATHSAVTNTFTLTVTAPLIASTIIFADAAPTKAVDIGTYKNTVTGNGTGAITYSSGTPSTATVNASTGVVTILAAGTTIITAVKAATATHSTVTNTYTLTVFIPVTVTLSKNTTSMLLGMTDTLTATVMPNDAINKSVTWSVSGSSTVVTVVNGLITGARLGIATVVVTTVDGRQAQCFVTVTNIASILNNFNLGRSMTYMPGLITQFGDAIGMNLTDYKHMNSVQQAQVQEIMISAPPFTTLEDIRNTFDQAVASTILTEINTATMDSIANAITDNAAVLGLDLELYNLLSPEQQIIVQGYLIFTPNFVNWYSSFAEVQTSFNMAVSNAQDAEAALAEINIAAADTIESALTSNEGLLGLSLSSYNLYGNKIDLNTLLADLVFTNPFDLQMAINNTVLVPVNEINNASMATIATSLNDNATALGLNLELYNLLSPEQQVIVQSYLIFTPYFVNWYTSIAEVQTSFNTAVSNALAAEAALAEINAATAEAIESVLTSNAILLGLFLGGYDGLTMNEVLAAQDFTNPFDLQMAIYGW